jgi:hypothetical protein
MPGVRPRESSARRPSARDSSPPSIQLVRHADRAAQELIEAARARERELRRGAEDYAGELLGTLELNLTRLTAAVHRGGQRLRRAE